MARILGIQLPDQKKVKIALGSIYGIGPALSKKILASTQIDPEKRAKELTDQEIQVLQKKIEQYPVEGRLRKYVSENIKRLKQIGTYRGTRHSMNLPVRGQRTRTNARTKRGKRQTVGALRKEEAQKLEKGPEEKKSEK